MKQIDNRLFLSRTVIDNPIKGKAAISFENIMKVWAERITPEEKADAERSWQEFSQKYISQIEG